MKPIRLFLLAIFLLSGSHAAFSQNDGMFKHNKKERKRVTRGWSKKRDAYNPYLKKKNKNKPSVQAAASNKRELRKQRRDYKRQLKRAKKGAH